MNDARSSDPLDPLQGFTGLSLFHQSFKAIPDSSTSIPFDFDLNLQAIHYQFNSMNNEVVPEKAEDNPLERIPASGRELARFSVKPNSSQPNMCSLPPFDISRHENARKGKENLRGGACVGCRSASHPFLISAQITISDELKSHLIEPSDNVEVAETWILKNSVMHQKDVRVKIQENMMRELSLAQVDLTLTLRITLEALTCITGLY